MLSVKSRITQVSLRMTTSLMLVLSIGAPVIAVSQVKSKTKSSTTQIIDSLPNGLKYYIQSNALPAKRAYLWLAVKAGALHEDEDQLGFAHFFEHMAFNGTRNFPGNTLIDVVEKSGMRFGADLNAYTSFDETVYQLTMPTDDSVLLNQGLQIIQDWADGSILNDSLEVVNERGVILGEWRARLLDTGGVRRQREGLERIFGEGTRYAKRIPIGDPDLIREATPAVLDRFYKDWYRPDLMAVMIVGDFDAVEMEKQVRARFGSIPKPKNPRQFEVPTVARKDVTTVRLVKDFFNPRIIFDWPMADFNPDPRLAMREILLERLTVPYMNRIATAMVKRERRPFAAGGMGRSSEFPRQTGNRYTMQVSAYPDSMVFGFSSLLTELERVAQQGIPAEILEREKASLLRSYEQYADGSAAISSRTIVSRFLGHYQVDGKAHLWSPEEALSIVREVLPAIKNKDVADFASRWRAKEGRIVTVIIPKFSSLRFVTDTTVHTLLDSIQKLQLSGESPFLDVADNRGGTIKTSERPGVVTEAEKFPETGVSRFTLSNGARVIHKQTSVNPDEVVIQAFSPGGHSLLPDSLFGSPARLVALLMNSAGGVGGKTHNELADDLSTTGIRNLRVGLNAFSEEMVVSGSPRELETMFQLMHLQFTNPTIDTTALSEWRRTGGRTLQVSQNDNLAARLGRHRRLAPPQAASVPFIDVDQAMHVYRDRFGDASDFTFVVVGAVDAETVQPLLEKYIANLPSTHRKTKETPKSFNIPNPVVRAVDYAESPAMSAERAITNLSFRGDMALIPAEANSLQLSQERLKVQTLSLILGRRLLKRLREEMAVTYSVSSPVVFYKTPEPRYAINISLLTPPEMIDTSTGVIWEEIGSLYKEGPTEEELSIAHTILTRRFENAGQSNMWWVSSLLDLESDGLPLSPISAFAPRPFTAEQIRDAAVTYLPQDVYTQRTVKPTAKVIEASRKKKEQEKEKK